MLLIQEASVPLAPPLHPSPAPPFPGLMAPFYPLPRAFSATTFTFSTVPRSNASSVFRNSYLQLNAVQLMFSCHLHLFFPQEFFFLDGLFLLQNTWQCCRLISNGTLLLVLSCCLLSYQCHLLPQGIHRGLQLTFSHCHFLGFLYRAF